MTFSQLCIHNYDYGSFDIVDDDLISFNNIFGCCSNDVVVINNAIIESKDIEISTSGYPIFNIKNSSKLTNNKRIKASSVLIKGYVGGIGINAQDNSKVINNGIIFGGFSNQNGTIGGAGINANDYSSIINNQIIYGGISNHFGAIGGVGINLHDKSSLSNFGLIYGGSSNADNTICGSAISAFGDSIFIINKNNGFINGGSVFNFDSIPGVGINAWGNINIINSAVYPNGIHGGSSFFDGIEGAIGIIASNNVIINNSGSIYGGSSNYISGIGIDISDSKLINTGTIKGNTGLIASNSTITSNGRIIGINGISIILNGNNRLTLINSIKSDGIIICNNDNIISTSNSFSIFILNKGITTILSDINNLIFNGGILKINGIINKLIINNDSHIYGNVSINNLKFNNPCYLNIEKGNIDKIIINPFNFELNKEYKILNNCNYNYLYSLNYLIKVRCDNGVFIMLYK